MATGRPKYNRSVKKQNKSTYKRNYDEGQKADATCKCRAGKKTVCQYCKKSPKKLKLIKGKTTEEPEIVIVPSAASVVTEEGGSRVASQYWDVNFREYFSKNFRNMREIKPGIVCYKIKFFKDNIWAPVSNENVVKVYNKIGKVRKNIRIIYPRSVEEADNGDTFIACVSGLYILDGNEAPHKMYDGNFSDLFAHIHKVYALECEKKLLMEFCYRPGVDDLKRRWRSEKEWRVDEAHVLDKLIVTGDKDLQFYVSHYNSHKVSLYNSQGKCIQQFGSRQEAGDGNIWCPWLCGVDKQSHLLVADQGNNVYKILDPSKGQWRSTGLRGERWVYDATVDDEGNLWMCQSNGRESVITKQEQH